MKNKDAQRLAKLSVKSRKANKPPEYWSQLASSGAAARWKGHVKAETKRGSKDQIKWRNENPEKVAAHAFVQKAIKDGRLVRKACFCGVGKSEAHHEDYSKPLEVIWLCKKHHVLADKARRSKLST